MPLPKFHEVLADPAFQTATVGRQSEINNAYWNAYDKENPGDEWGKQQRADTTRALHAKSLSENAAPITKRGLDIERDAANTRIRLRNMDATGEFKTPEERQSAFDAAALAEKESRAKLQKTASLFDPEVDKEMQPAWQSLEKSAANGQYFDEQGTGTKLYNAAADILPGGQSYDKTAESRKFYEQKRNELATQFNLQPAEVDDLVRHRMGKQKDPISRDAAGVIHVKDELLVKPVEELSSAIEESNLSPATKQEALVQAPFKIAQFKEGVVQNVQKNHPELAAEIKFTGDVSKDYVAITDVLNKSRTEQAIGGAAAYGNKRVEQFGVGAQIASGSIPGVGQIRPAMTGEEMRNAQGSAERATKRQEAINQLSLQINQDKVKILGTDAATVGQGVASMAESMVIAAATGGAGNALISAERIAKAGKVGAALLKFGQGAANIAPTAGIYGVDQGLSTYEQAMASDDPAVRARAGELALKSGLIEAGVTTVFGGVGAGGAETMAQRLVSGEARREAAMSLKQAWKNLGKNLVEVPLEEIPEETLITALDSVHVQKQLNPQMTDADVKKAIYDTMVSTLITTAPMGVFNVAKEAKKDFSKSTHEQTTDELHGAADDIYKTAAQENLPETPTATGTLTAGSTATVADIERARTEQIALTEDPEEKQALQEATPEELAGEWGVKLEPNQNEQDQQDTGGEQNTPQALQLPKVPVEQATPTDASTDSSAPEGAGAAKTKTEDEVVPAEPEELYDSREYIAKRVSEGLTREEAFTELETKRDQYRGKDLPAGTRVLAPDAPGANTLSGGRTTDGIWEKQPDGSWVLLTTNGDTTQVKYPNLAPLAGGTFITNDNQQPTESPQLEVPVPAVPGNELAADPAGEGVLAGTQSTDTLKPINLELRDTTVMTRDETGEPSGERPAKSFTATDPGTDSRAIGTLDGEKLQVTDIRTKKEGVKTTGTRFFERLVRSGQSNGASTVEVKLQSADTRAVLNRLVEKGVLTNPRQIVGNSMDRHPTLFDIAPATSPPLPPTAENALAEIARLVAVVPQGLAQPGSTPGSTVAATPDAATSTPSEVSTSKKIDAPKLVQGTLFQSSEPQGDPNAIKLVRSYKGSPPKGATRALIDYAGEPLLSDLGDLPAHTVRDIKEADQIIQETTGSKTQRTSDPGGREDAGEAGPARQLTLFQNEERNKGYYQPGVRGAAQATIGFFGSADASTGVHEYWHDLAENDFFGILTPEEVKTIRDWETDGTGTRDTNAKEKGARGWERFLFEGASTGFAEVDTVLSKLSEWLRSIYQGIQGSSLNVDISPEVRAIMEKLVTRAARGEKVVVTPTKVVREAPAPAKSKPKKKIPKLRSMPSSTSIKNAETDKILAAAGLPEIMAPARQSNEDTWDEAMRVVGSDPRAGSRIVSGIVKSGRSVNNEVEEGVLLHETAIRKADVVRARALLAKNPGDPGLVAELKEAQAALYEVVVADKLAGTAWGRIGQFRQRSIKEDFTLEAMEARFRADVNEGAALSGADSKYVAELQKRITEAEAAARKAEVELGEAAQREAALVKKLAETKPRAAPVRRSVSERAKDGVEAARAVVGRFARLAQKAEGRLYQESDLTPDELDAFAVIGSNYIVEGVGASLESFASKLTGEYPGAEPFIEEIYQASRDRLAKLEAGSRAKTPIELKNLLDKENPQISNKLIYNMARGFINQGLEGRDVLDAVTKLLNEDFPDLTREEVVEAFTGYGKVKYPSKEEDLVKLRELRNIERIQRQIDDVRQGLTPKKTGQQRDAATLKIRELKKELQEAMRAMGIKHAVNKNQLRGALDAIKSRYKNEIEELEESIRTKTKRKERRFTLEYDDEIKALKARRDKLKADYDNTFGVSRKAITEQQRVKAAVKSLTKRIAEEEAMLKAGILERIKVGSRTTLTPEIIALRTKLDGLRAAREKAREALHPKRTPEERALARALSAAQKSIDRYNAVLSGTPVPGKAPSPLTPNAALNALWSQRNVLREAVEKLRKAARPRLSADEKARRQAVAQLDKSIKEIERRIATGDFSIKPKSAGRAVGFPDVVALKAQRDSLRKTFEALQKASQPQLTPEEKKDNALVRAANTRRAKIEARIAAGDYVKVERVTPVMSAKVAAARLAESKAKEEWNRGFFEAELKKRTLGKKSYDTAVEVLNFSRTMKTIADVSAVLRQGLVTMITHPFLSLRAVPDMFRAGFSEVQMQRIKDQIEAHPRYGLSQQAKLFLADTGPDTTVAKIEEAFRGRWAKQIPGLKGVVNFSERTYNAYLNSVRMAHFNSLVESVGGNPTVKEAKILADFVNKATGRGDLRSMESAAAGLAAVFFSPKFVVSRFQLIWGAVPVVYDVATGFQLRNADVRKARKAIAKEYVRFIVGAAAIYGLVALAKAGYGDDDDEIETDPRSSNFGKIKLGNTYIDPMGGLLQAAVFSTRMILGETKTQKGEVQDLHMASFGKQSYLGVLGSFLRSKLSPVPSAYLNVRQGADVVGSPATVESEFIGSVIPLAFGDVYETMRENGVARGTPLAVLGLLGLGVQSRSEELSLEQYLATLAGSDPVKYSRKRPSASGTLKVPTIKQ